VAIVTISEASRLTGKSRSTIYLHKKQGKLSLCTTYGGRPAVDTSELLRVYGPFVSHGTDQDYSEHNRTTNNPQNNNVLSADVNALKEVLSRQDEVISDLRETLRRRDREAEEREKWLRERLESAQQQIMAITSQQRDNGQVKPKRGWWPW
jgi:hypothetical protein